MSLKPLVFFADPGAHLGICVSECPSPADPRDGFLAGELICTDKCSGLDADGKLEKLGECCFPAYATTAANGYCLPDQSVSASSLKVGFDKQDMRYRASRGGAIRTAPRFWPSDADLDLVRDRLSSAGKEFADMVSDLEAVHAVLVACTCGALALSLLMAAVFLMAPVATTVASMVTSLIAFACLTAALWSAGESIMADNVNAPLSGEYAYGFRLATTGYMCCALTVLYSLGALYAGSSLVGRLGDLVHEVGKALREAPALYALIVGGLLATLVVLLWWFFVAVNLASTGLLEVSPEGFPLPTFNSVIVRLLTAHTLAGILLLFLVQHLCRMCASGLAAVWYYRKHMPSQMPAQATAGETPGAADVDPAGSRGGPQGMSAAGKRWAEPAFDASTQRVVVPALDAASAAWLVCRFHLGSVVCGALLLPLMWPLRLVSWFFRPCRLGARGGDQSVPDPMSAACQRGTPVDWLFFLNVDAYASVFALDLNFAPAARVSWLALVEQPPGVAAALQSADLCFYSLKFAIAALCGAVAGLVLSVNDGRLDYSASLLYPMAWTFLLSYLTASQFVQLYEAVLSGIVTSFCMDTTHNPPELWHASPALQRVLGSRQHPGALPGEAPALPAQCQGNELSRPVDERTRSVRISEPGADDYGAAGGGRRAATRATRGLQRGVADPGTPITAAGSDIERDGVGTPGATSRARSQRRARPSSGM